MTGGKQIIALSGGGHKGVVKILYPAGRSGFVKGSCNLDFRPSNARLYLVGDDVAQIALNDINTNFEIPFSSEGEICCVLRSSSQTMFGGKCDKSAALAKVDKFLRDSGLKNTRRNRETQPVSESDAPPQQPKVDCEKDDEGDKNSGVEVGTNGVFLSESAAADEVKSAASGEWTKYDGNNFYYAVKPQLDEMFIRYPEEELLAACVQNSKWVRVDAEDGCYVVGVLYDGSDPAFICYGVPASDAKRPPDELDGMCVWLSVGKNDRGISGYWVIYQSAKTGEIIK